MASAGLSPVPRVLTPPVDIASRRGKFFRPLSPSGKPIPVSPDGSARFRRVHATPSQPTPYSPPMSPMSSLSYGTFADSEGPMTPYSTRGPNDSEISTPMVLSPVSAPELEWEMANRGSNWEAVVPEEKFKTAPGPLWTRNMPPASSSRKEIKSETSLSSHPLSYISVDQHVQKENVGPADNDHPAADPNADAADAKVEESQPSLVAPLEKIATKVRAMLRRAPATEKKKKAAETRAEKRRKRKDDLDYMEDVHWTEM